jgi:CRP-like cAMP-binding protein
MGKSLRVRGIVWKRTHKQPIRSEAVKVKALSLSRSLMREYDVRSSNQLLASMSEGDWQRWQPQLKLVELSTDQVLYESGDKLQQIHFPATAIVSLLHILENGGSTEIAMTGREGMVGISAFMGSNSSPYRGVVQQAGWSYKAPALFVLKEFESSPDVMHLMLRFTQALITQMSQVAVCNRHHAIEQQLCRWLLLNFDRIDLQVLDITQERIASLLGVRREGITRAAGLLQEQGLIQYNRGHLHLIDREGLHAKACECYDVVKQGYEQLQTAELAL